MISPKELANFFSGCFVEMLAAFGVLTQLLSSFELDYCAFAPDRRTISSQTGISVSIFLANVSGEPPKITRDSANIHCLASGDGSDDVDSFVQSADD